MSVRKPTLEEWFLAYQLRKMARDHVHIQGHIDVDVTAIDELYRARGRRAPYTALAVKALALAARRVPEMNRAYLRTFLGDRVVEFDTINVNMPIMLAENGREHTAAVLIPGADALSVAEIEERIATSKRRTLDETRLTKHVARRPNTFWNRLLLRVVHFFAYHFPRRLEQAGAGGLSVSSLVLRYGEDAPRYHGVSLGPTATTLLVTGVRHIAGRVVLELGLGFDHTALTGVQMRRAINAIHDVFTSREAGEFA